MISYVNKLGTVRVGGSNPVRIMGILNTSPESFYKKSISIGREKIIDAVSKMEDEGADFIDIGGMSTAPYLSTMVSEKTETDRVVKAIKIIQHITNLPISVFSGTIVDRYGAVDIPPISIKSAPSSSMVWTAATIFCLLIEIDFL